MRAVPEYGHSSTAVYADLFLETKNLRPPPQMGIQMQMVSANVKARAGAEQFEATAGKYTEDVMVIIAAFGGMVLLAGAFAALRKLRAAYERRHNNLHIV